MGQYTYRPQELRLGNEQGSERASFPDRAMRVVGSTSVLTLSPGGTDVTADEGAIYSLGKVKAPANVGRYRIWLQTKTGDTPLGVPEFMDFDVFENTAGVFLTRAVVIESAEGGTAADDADDTDTLRSGTDFLAGAATLNDASQDTALSVFVVTSTNVTHAAAWTEAATLVEGELVVLDALGDQVDEVRIQRLS